ncbi:MAG TPA: hypothetical protein VN894_04265, partial [Polyangiaceae bacterium]|nr:hypothetical protein [Polyangiaceae bacterium]
MKPRHVSGYAVFWTALLVACGSTVPLGSGNPTSGDGGNLTASGVEGGSPGNGGDVEGGPSRGGIEG